MTEQLSLHLPDEPSKHTPNFEQAPKEISEQEKVLARLRTSISDYKTLLERKRSDLPKIRLIRVSEARIGKGLFDGSEFARLYVQPVEDLLDRIANAEIDFDILENPSFLRSGKTPGIIRKTQELIQDLEDWAATSQS